MKPINSQAKIMDKQQYKSKLKYSHYAKEDTVIFNMIVFGLLFFSSLALLFFNI